MSENMQVSDVEYFEKMTLCRALKYPELRRKLKLEVEHFLDERHGAIYEKLLNDMNFDDEALITASVLDGKLYGDYDFVRTVIDFPISGPHGTENDQLGVYRLYKERVTSELAKKYLQEPDDDTANELARVIEQLDRFDVFENDPTLEVLNEITDEIYGEGETFLTPTGVEQIDTIIDGVGKKQFNIIAARPSMGKTALAIHLAMSLARQGCEVVFCSLETGRKNLIQRALANVSGIPLRAIINPRNYMTTTEAERVVDSFPLYYDLGIKIKDKDVWTPSKIRRIANNMDPGRHGVIFIDYLQLMIPDNKSRGEYEDVSMVSRELKQIVQDFDHVTIFALSQLGRSVEQRQDKRPLMSDLRSSGQLEQDADMIAMLYRDDYYNPPETDPSVLEWNLVKNKDGTLGTAELAYYKRTQQIL